VEKSVRERVRLNVAASDRRAKGDEISHRLQNRFRVIGECQRFKGKNTDAPFHGGVVLAEAGQFGQSGKDQPDRPVGFLHHSLERVLYLLCHDVASDLIVNRR
jgi:hypothetical protein